VAKRKASEPPPSVPPPPLEVTPTTKFKRDVERQKKRGKDMTKLQAVIESLCHHRALEARHKDHPLAGEWEGYRDCHIEPDWLMIYLREGGKLVLARTGTHSDLFRE
jgi:mRNA interferase YafQ